MKKMILVMICIFGILNIFAKDPDPRKLCNSLADCISKAENTDIHRKKISLYDDAINFYSGSDKNKKLYQIYLLRANSLVKEASGDTGYKGEIPLKVSHKPEYKQAQFEKARNDLRQIDDKSSQFSVDEGKLYDELKRVLNSEN